MSSDKHSESAEPMVVHKSHTSDNVCERLFQIAKNTDMNFVDGVDSYRNQADYSIAWLLMIPFQLLKTYEENKETSSTVFDKAVEPDSRESRKAYAVFGEPS